MKKVLKFVKGKRDDRRERVSPNTALSSSENLHSPTEIMTLGDGMEACDGQKYYLDISGRDKSVTKLHKAAWQGNLDKVKAVMKKADIDIPDKFNRTPLHLAAACGYNSVVHFLLINNARTDIRDSEGKTPLLKAAECGQKEVIITLLERGGDLHSVDFEGNSPLHLTVKNCYYDLSVLLLKRGSNFELPNKDGDIPLHIATAVEQIDIVELLLRYGSDVNVLSGDMTPLMIAARVGNTDLVKLFLDYGADCKLKDLNGWTAEDHAQMTSNQNVMPLLQTDSQPSSRYAEKNANARVDEGIGTLSTSKNAGEKGVKEKEEEESYSAAKEASDGNEENSDTWNDSQISEQPINAKIDKVKLQAFLQEADGDEYKPGGVNKGERGQPEGGDTDAGMDGECSGRGSLAGRVDLQDSPKSCPTPPPLKPPRSWDFLQTGVVGNPGNSNSNHQNNKPRQRSLFTIPTRDDSCDGPKTDNFVEEVIKVSRASSLNESSSMGNSDNSGVSCLERNDGHSSRGIYESSPRDPWKLRGKAAKGRNKENKRETKEDIADVIKENEEEIKQENLDVADGAASNLAKDVEDDLIVVYSDASDWESSSGGEGSIGSSDEVDLPMDNLPILVLPENDDECSKPIREEGSRRMSGKLGIAEEEEDDESLSVAALSPATSSVSERRNRFLQRSQSIDLGDEELSTEDETAMENEEEEDGFGMRKKSDGGGTEPSETASREMTTVLEVEGPRLQGKTIPSLGAVGREDTLHGYEEVWESNPQLCPRSCSRGSSSEGPHSPSTPRSPFLEVGFPGRREDRLHPFGRSRSSVGDSDHRSGDESSASTKTNRRRSEDSDRKQEPVNNGYKGCYPKDLRTIPKKFNLSESEGESHTIPSIDIEFTDDKNGKVQKDDAMQAGNVIVSRKVQDESIVVIGKIKGDMEMEYIETSINSEVRREMKMDVEELCVKEKANFESHCNAEMSSENVPVIHMADKANAQTWNVRVDTEMEVEFQMNNDTEKPPLGKVLLKPATRSPPCEESEGEDSVFLDDDDVKDERKIGAQGLIGPLGWGGVSWRLGGATPWRGGANRNLGPLPSSPRSLGENGPEPTSSVADQNVRPHMSSAHSLPSQLSHLALHEEKEDIFNSPLNPTDSTHSVKDAQTESSTNFKLRDTRGYSSLDQPEDIRLKAHTVEKNTSKLSVMLSLPKNIERMNLDEELDNPKAVESEDKKHRIDENIPRSRAEMSVQEQPPRTPKRKKTQRSSSLQASHPPDTPERSPNRTNPGILKRACSMGKTVIPTKGPPLPPAKDFALLVTSEKDRPQRPSDIKVIEIPCTADNVLSPPILVSPQEYRSMKPEDFRAREDRRGIDDGRSRDDARRKDKARAKLESKSESREDTRGRLKRYDRIDSSEGKLKDVRRHSGNIREEFMAMVDTERPPKRPPRRHKSLTSESHRSSSPLVKRSLSLSGQASMAAAMGQARVSQRVVQVEIMAQQQRRRKRRRAALLHPSLDRNDPSAMGGSTEDEDDRKRWETQHSRTQSRESAGGTSLRALERRQRLDPSEADGCPSSKESDNSLDGYKVGGSEDEDSESSSEDLDSPAKARALMGRSKEELADGNKREKDRIFNSHSGKVSRGHQRVPIAMREQLRASAEERGRLEGEACRLEEQLQTLTWEAEEAREGERAAAALVAALAARVTRLEADTARLAEAGARAKLRIANREQEVMHLREVCMKYEEQKQNLAEIIRLKSIERENLERKLADKDEEEKFRKMETKSSSSNELEARLNLLEQERQILEGSNARLEGELESLRAELEEVRKGVLLGVSSAKAEAEGKVEARLATELRELQEEVQQWKEKYEFSQVTKDERIELKKESSSDAEAQVELPCIESAPVERKDGEAQVNTVGELDVASALAVDGRRPPLARGKSLPAQTRAFLRDAATNTSTIPAANTQALAAAKAKELEITKELIREREKSRKNAHMIKKLRAEIQAMKKAMEDAARMAAEAKEEEMKKKIAEMQERNELGAFGDEFGPVSEDVAELRKQVTDLESMLRKESSSRESLQNQIGKLMEDLQSMSIANCKLKEEKANIEQELSSALVRLEAEENGWRREVERLGRAHQGEMERARADARNELSARLSQLNQFLQQQAQEQSRLEKQRMNSEAQLMREFEETKRQLLGEIATLQAALQVKGEEERELRQKCDRLLRENERREEQRRKRLVERAYSVNFPPAEPIFDLSREKPAPTSVSFSGAPIGGEGLPSPPSPLQSKSHIIPAPPAFLERGKVGMTSSLSLPKPPPVVFLSPPPPGRDALRRELDRSIRKHGRTESLDLEHLRAMAPEKPSTDERLEILRKKYFLP